MQSLHIYSYVHHQNRSMECDQNVWGCWSYTKQRMGWNERKRAPFQDRIFYSTWLLTTRFDVTYDPALNTSSANVDCCVSHAEQDSKCVPAFHETMNPQHTQTQRDWCMNTKRKGSMKTCFKCCMFDVPLVKQSNYWFSTAGLDTHSMNTHSSASKISIVSSLNVNCVQSRWVYVATAKAVYRRVWVGGRAALNISATESPLKTEQRLFLRWPPQLDCGHANFTLSSQGILTIVEVLIPSIIFTLLNISQHFRFSHNKVWVRFQTFMCFSSWSQPQLLTNIAYISHFSKPKPLSYEWQSSDWMKTSDQFIGWMSSSFVSKFR